jgi:GH15 family glucan-1,4-alpha-glucosidase
MEDNDRVKYALIGNCAYQALIDDRASVVWMCWPRFDSSFVFGALLDTEKGGDFAVIPEGDDYETEQHYLPNTNIVRTLFRSGSGSFEVIDFAPRFRQYDRSFKPTQLMRRVRRLSGDPRLRVRVQPTLDYGRSVPDHYEASNHIKWNVPGAALRLTTTVPLTYVLESRPFLLERDAYFALTWGTPMEAPLEETVDSFLVRTQRYWERWVKHTSMPGCFQEEVIRSALALKLHQFEDTGAITAASTTSLPEEHGSGRNWDYRFCWLRDSYFTLRAMRRLGHFEEIEGFVGFLKNIAELHPDALQPVFSISGDHHLHETELDHLSGYMGNRPVRAGNAAYKQVQNDVYGEMIGAIAPLLLDIRFQDYGGVENTIRLVRRLLHRIEATMHEPDAGIWEYRDMASVHAFSLLLHWTGGKVAERIGKHVGDAELTVYGTKLAAQAHDLLETKCFTGEFYGDSTTSQNPDASLFMMVNLGYLDPRSPRAEQHVRALARELGQSGGLMQRYRHLDDFGHSQSTFTVCGFWYAEALARLGFRDEAQEACEHLARHANHVGLFSEDVDPTTGEQLGNFPQTYSHVGLINTAFAISPFPEGLQDP